jgi:choline dehydrogenase
MSAARCCRGIIAGEQIRDTIDARSARPAPKGWRDDLNSSEHWDYIIVGAGAAGCVVAHRLAASGEHRVLLLEAGGSDDRLWIRVPAGFTKTLFDPRIGWGYANAPAPATGNRIIPCPRGRVLGGSSSINGHLYVRGQALDYDGWAHGGAPGWGWGDVLPFFQRSETRPGGDPAVRGTQGPLHVADPRMQHPLCEAFLQSLQALGVPRNADYNGGDQEGAGYYQYLIRHGRRWSAADAYLRPALSSSGLTVRQNAQAMGIVFEGQRAVGVRYRFGNELRTVRAAREVILAAGAINTPQLLQLSGVGDAALLSGLRIPVVLDAPGVGEQLVDHYAVRIAARVRGAQSLNERSHGARLLLEVLKYATARQGILASAVAHAFGFVRVTPGADRPDLQLLFAPASYEAGKMGQTGLEREPGLTCGICQLRPESRGHVRIVSKDPLVAPQIQPNYLDDPRDREFVVRGVRFVRELFATSPLAGLIASETWPGAQVDTDAALEDFIRHNGSTVYHPVGSCRMGIDAGSPVDPLLRVKGLEGLRVIDASVMPSMVSGNTYAATIMIAEKGAQHVLDAR